MMTITRTKRDKDVEKMDENNRKILIFGVHHIKKSTAYMEQERRESDFVQQVRCLPDIKQDL